MDQIDDFVAEQRRQTEDGSQSEGFRRRDRDRERRSHSPQRSYRDDDLPSSTIKIKNLSSSITERDIRHYLDDKGIQYSSVRLVKDRRTGHTKGFGFVEFYTEEEARDWMTENDGEAHIRGYSVRLCYCSPRDADEDYGDSRSDYSSSRDIPWKHEEPRNTIMLRGIPSTFTERDIRGELDALRINYADVRLIRDKRSGQSRGFGFVEFETIQEAKDWMETQQGLFRVRQCDLCMLYSSPRVSMDALGGRSLLGPGDRIAMANSMSLLGDKNIPFGDWNCSRCGTHNFKRRDYCFKCNFSRLQNQAIIDTNDGTDYVGNTPCNTIILRNLDALTTEENITLGLRAFSGAEVKQVRVMRDEMTSVSYCYAFVELNSVATACQIVDILLKENPIFEVDGKAITVNYAKNTYSTILASLEQKSRQQAASLAQPVTSGFAVMNSFPVMSNAANTVGIPQTMSYAGNATANAAAAVAQAALQQKQAQQQFAAAIVHSLHHGQLAGQAGPGASVGHISALHKQQLAAIQLATQQAELTRQSTPQPSTPYDAATALHTKYPTPDTSSFAFEESSGFYYDATTGLYYDSNSHYFYDAKTTTYVYWDPQRSTYLPAPSSTQAAATEGVTEPDDGSVKSENEQVKKEKEKKEKAKTAKKIAKEMEKWAKAMNSQKPMIQSGVAPIKEPGSMTQHELSSKSADTGFAMLEAVSSGGGHPPSGSLSTFVGGNHPPGGGIAGLVAQYGGDSDNDEGPGEDSGPPPPPPPPSTTTGGGGGRHAVAPDVDPRIAEEEAKLIDWNKLACLLCARGFKDVETLRKHQNFSDLHKKNVEGLRNRISASGNGVSQAHPDDSGNDGGKGVHHYRDRAKERRDKYGVPSPPRSSKRSRVAPAASSSRADRDSPPVVTPSNLPVYEEPEADQDSQSANADENVGSRLMQKMGWQSGQGLGRANQGRIEIVEPEFRAQGVGLGAPGAQSKGPPSENYKDNVKRAMFARYHDAN